jgi:hypothetical protein
MKLFIMLLFVALFAVGCSGEAEITVVNNTDYYVSGDIDGHSYGVVSGRTTKRSVEVGGFLDNSSKITINAYVPSTGAHLSKTYEMEKDHTYTYEVYSYYCGSSSYRMRLKTVESNSNIVAP